MIWIPVLTLLFPLSQFLTQLQQELSQNQKDNQLIQVGTELWRDNFAKFRNGESRSEINKLLISEQEQNLFIHMNVVTKKGVV